MSSEKRPASESFGTTQLVKRQKSDANLTGASVALVNNPSQNGALIQAVRNVQLVCREAEITRQIDA